MIKKISFLIIITVLAVITACTPHTYDSSPHDAGNLSERAADSLSEKILNLQGKTQIAKRLFIYYIEHGENEKLTKLGARIFNYSTSSGKPDMAIMASAYMAYPYILTNKPDSARLYLDYLRFNIDKHNPYYGIYNNAEAVYSIKFEFDYPKAISFLMKALEFYKEENNLSNQAIILSNITSLYSRREDTSGTKYAKEAYRISKDIQDPYLQCISMLSLSQMEIIGEKNRDAAGHIKQAMKTIEDNRHLLKFSAECYTLAGDIYSNLGKKDSAEFYYGMAFDNLQYNSDENIHIMLYLSYADYLYKTGKYEEAKSYYLLGIKTSEKNGNIDNMHHLLKGLSSTYEALGKEDSALFYHKQYYEASTKAFNLYKEKEFNQLFLDYEKVRYEMKISHSKRTIIIISAILAIAIIISIALIYVNKKKDRMYTILVEQHQQSLQQAKLQKKMEKEICKEKEDAKAQNERELFEKLEKLMSSDKIYRETDITIEKLATMLDSNRTYISSVINKYSGTTFPNYLNKYRINEAISIISDPDTDIVLKAVYSEIGYKSMTSFYRAFQKETGCTPSVYREKVLKLKKEKQNTEDSAMAAE